MKKMIFAHLAAFVLVSGCAREVLSPADTIVENTSILNFETGEYLQDHLVVVNQGVITEIVPASEKKKYSAAMIIDGANGYLIPGLSDAHVHLRGPEELKNYIRYGVTSVVNLSGNPSHLEMRELIAKGNLDGPKIFTAGPTLDGEQVTNPLFTSVTPDTASDVIEWINQQGYDFIKVYQQMEPETLSRIVTSANASGLITTGHISRETGVENTLTLGQKFVPHGEELAFEFFDEASGSYDRSGLKDLASLLRKSDVTVTPMINYLENIAPQALDLDAYLNSKQMKTVPASMKQSWDARQGYYSNRSEPEIYADQTRKLAAFVADLTFELHKEGVRLTLGTDAGFGGAVPGYSVHEELKSSVRAGLSPIEALKTATLNVSLLLKEAGVSDWQRGVIKEGYAADFLLLESDPLQDIENTRDISGVSLRGEWFDRTRLTKIEAELAQQQIERLPLVQAVEDFIVEGNADGLRSLVLQYLENGGTEALIVPENCIFLGYRYYYGGQRALAGEIYESCAAMSPNHAPLHIHIGRAKEASGDIAGAISAYRSGFEINPWYGNPEAAIKRLSEVQ